MRYILRITQRTLILSLASFHKTEWIKFTRGFIGYVLTKTQLKVEIKSCKNKQKLQVTMIFWK